ncbi:alpha/beta fold hydrolase [Miltoncostaea oceani]|uniref:alpha/beta fold hydrolase n=1 Tax=Miltoncostaea oceani TaxID=2843216 RepID=UPI001C3E3A0A|nr:alpha/beta fold hydrolase [Miltoncostaea oceani]
MPATVPLVLLHPFPTEAAFWRELVAALPGDRPVVLPEFPGLGGAPPRADATVDGFADEVAERIGREAPEGRAVVCGLSLGGYVALSLAVRHPDRVAGLVLADTRAEADTPEARDGRHAAAAQVRAGGTAGFLDGFVPKLVAPGDADALARARALADAQDPEGVARALEALAGRADRVADLPGVAAPTLVIVGEHDGLTPPDFARTLAAGIPGAELVVIPGAGHLTALEAPDAFAAALTGFLARRLPGS